MPHKGYIYSSGLHEGIFRHPNHIFSMLKDITHEGDGHEQRKKIYSAF